MKIFIPFYLHHFIFLKYYFGNCYQQFLKCFTIFPLLRDCVSLFISSKLNASRIDFVLAVLFCIDVFWTSTWNIDAWDQAWLYRSPLTSSCRMSISSLSVSPTPGPRLSSASIMVSTLTSSIPSSDLLPSVEASPCIWWLRLRRGFEASLTLTQLSTGQEVLTNCIKGTPHIPLVHFSLS